MHGAAQLFNPDPADAACTAGIRVWDGCGCLSPRMQYDTVMVRMSMQDMQDMQAGQIKYSLPRADA